MASSIKVTVVLTVFLFIGILLAGLIMQPRASTQVWDVKENDFPANGTKDEKLSFLLRYAILAPSAYNTQPWRFSVNGSEIRIFADKSRWPQVADADRRELNVSLGCALENILLAAENFGYGCQVIYLPGDGGAVASVRLSPASLARAGANQSLFQAIVSRQGNPKSYQNRVVQESALQSLGSSGAEEGIQIHLTSDNATRIRLRDLVVSADQIQYSDTNCRSEQAHWIGQGLMGPTGIQAILAQYAILLLNAGSDQDMKDAELVNSTPVMGFVRSRENDGISQMKAGRALERAWLAATAAGLALQPLSQVLEVPEAKAEVRKLLPDAAMYPQEVFCLGFAAAEEEHTPRRSLDDFLIKA